jgi:hypothetical protein
MDCRPRNEQRCLVEEYLESSSRGGSEFLRRALYFKRVMGLVNMTEMIEQLRNFMEINDCFPLTFIRREENMILHLDQLFSIFLTMHPRLEQEKMNLLSMKSVLVGHAASVRKLIQKRKALVLVNDNILFLQSELHKHR